MITFYSGVTKVTLGFSLFGKLYLYMIESIFTDIVGLLKTLLKRRLLTIGWAVVSKVWIPWLLDLRALLNQDALEDTTDQDHPQHKSIVLYKITIRGGQSSSFTYKLLLS